jgi:hypothetical protein
VIERISALLAERCRVGVVGVDENALVGETETGERLESTRRDPFRVHTAFVAQTGGACSSVRLRLAATEPARSSFETALAFPSSGFFFAADNGIGGASSVRRAGRRRERRLQG